VQCNVRHVQKEKKFVMNVMEIEKTQQFVIVQQELLITVKFGANHVNVHVRHV